MRGCSYARYHVHSVIILGVVVTVSLRWKRTFNEPMPEFYASTDSAVIAMGRYLAYGPAHCAYCHTTAEMAPALDRGEQTPALRWTCLQDPAGHVPDSDSHAG